MKGTLKILLWKHFVVRVRRYFHSPIEILSTVLLFIILFADKDNLLKRRINYQYELNVEQSAPVLLNSVTGPENIYYTPENELTRLLMSRIKEDLAYSIKDEHNRISNVLKYEYKKTLVLNIRDVMELIVSNRIKKPKIKSVASESYVTDVNDAFVVFQNVSGIWPKKLSYTIRMVGAYEMHSYRYLNNEAVMYYDIIYEPFLKLQWAIDSNYLELLTGANITQRVNLQQFPYIWASKDLSVKKITKFLYICCWLSLMLVSVFLSARLMDERVTGILELIKMSGVSNNVIGLSHLINVVPAGIIYCFVGTLVITVSSQPLISNTNPLLILIMLLLYYIKIIALAFCVSYMSDSASYSETMAVLMYLLLYIPAALLEDRELPRWSLPLCGLLPHVPMHWFWDEVAARQQYGKDLTFADIVRNHSAKNDSVLTCYMCLILQAFFFFGFAWYLSRVRPGPHGQGMPWNFLFQRQYWGIKLKTPEGHEELLEFDDTRYNMDYFEAAPRDLKPGIKILNVSKNYGKELALAEVSFNVYQGEITVLLGHNGAGKTTLISIIMGKLKPTEGKVLVEGLDTVTQKDKLQRIIGLCPQHNLFFPYLSVMEHVMFFTLLKGVSYEESKKSSQDLLKQLGLADKSSCQTSQLSGGMKRRLQLACALTGDAKVLVLDEPTSGLDVETRRGLWDLLLSLRGSRTVLLSTHFMEEAEALGDRVAALHAGRLRCHATTMHLKRALGTGYRLSFTTIGPPDEPAITAVITSKIPKATVNETSLNSISYNLPSKDSAKFPELFNFLKLKKSELGIDCIGIGASTLEDVFLKLCTEDAAELLNDIDSGSAEPVFKTVTGPRLYLRQLAVLFKRQLKYYWSKMSFFLTVKLIIPIMIIYFLTIMSSRNGGGSDPEALNISLNLDHYNKMADPKVLYSINVSGVNLKTIENKYANVDFELAPNFTAALFHAADKNILEYNKYLVGIQLNETDATVLFTIVEPYTPPVALNLLTNVIATRLLPYADGQTVITYNYPINRPKAYGFAVHYKDFILGDIWAVMVVFVMLTTTVSAVSLPCKERASGTRHIHVLSGCAPALHWAATLLTHALIYALVLVLPVVVVCIAFEQEHTFDRPDFLVVISVIFELGIISFLALAYIVSFMFEERASCVVLVSITFFFVLVLPFVEVLRGYHLMRIEMKAYEFFDYFLLFMSHGVPPHSMTNAARRSVDIAAYNARYSEKPQCYFCFEGEAPGQYMLAMAAQTLVFMAIVILAEYGVFNTMCDRVLNLKYKISSFTNSDEAVRAEREYVEKTIKLPKNQIQDAMLVNNLHKKYWRIFYSPCNPVKGVSFSVKKGECFGLVGVNGAGKSSMFKMMTGIEVPTRGSLYANGHFKTGLSTDYLRSLAYCPQSSGLDEFLTGYESLELILTLRGLEQSDVIKEAKAVIKVIGLEKYANSVVSSYSGGCERQLAAAVALSRGGAVTLLDEPTAGVGVAARRRVWAALLRARKHRAVVVTSHSMDEMEALCGRIAIMVCGRVRALGGPVSLRAAHTAGHAVALKLATFGAAHIADSTDYSKMLTTLKETLKRRLHWTLRQEQKTMLHFYINYTMRYSNLFSELEQLKAQFSIIEDYSVSETTLEEVFLTVTSKMYNDGPMPV